MPSISLTLTQAQHAKLREHLFPGDGREAVAFALCGHRRDSDRHRLLARRIAPVPYAQCASRTPVRVTWSTSSLPPLLEEAARNALGVVKIHGHGHAVPFSTTDDVSDRDLFPGVHAWAGDGPHASAVMFPDGRMIGRVVDADGRFHPVCSINVVGDDLPSGRPPTIPPSFPNSVAVSRRPLARERTVDSAVFVSASSVAPAPAAP